MTAQDFERLSDWFADYCKTFYSSSDEDRKNIVLKEYRLEAITGGANALCDVTVKLGDSKDAKLLSLGKSVGSDIVTTSVDAMIEGLNRLWVRKVATQNDQAAKERQKAY